MHPIRRIREVLKRTPEDLNLRRYSTAAGFAQLLGRSSSLIRNVECGITERWDLLAALIEKRTRVSKDWLLSNPGTNDPVLDVNGRVWEPGSHLDPLAPFGGMPDWRQLIQLYPSLVPEFVSAAIRAQLIWELSLGIETSLANMVAVFRRMRTYENPGIQALVNEQKCGIGDRILEKVWAQRKGTRVLRTELEARWNIELSSISSKEAERILAEQGFGWVLRLDQLPDKGPIPELLHFYRNQLSNSGQDESDQSADDFKAFE